VKISYVQQKSIDSAGVNQLLAESGRVNQFTNNGPVKKLLEEKLHSLFGLPPTKKVVVVNNGTSACHMIMFFYQKKEKKRLRWASPSFTFPTVVVNNNKTRLYDIEVENYTLPLEQSILDCNDVVVITNLFGTVPNNILEWIETCKSQKKKLIFDNASSPLSTVNGDSICSLGDMSFGSLHHTKYLGFGEGGFIVCDSEHYEDLNRIACFGFNIDKKYNRFSSNFKMSDVAAAYIFTHISNYDLKRHVEVQNYLLKELSGIEKFIPFNAASNRLNANLVLGNFPLTYDEKKLKRKDVIGFLRTLGIESNKYYKPLLMTHPNSVGLYNSMVNLPLNESISDYQVEYLVKVLKEI
jgi:dTDP-4-amino-4,6-dideoxygalactose transaminase